jgi:hypothetical protein
MIVLGANRCTDVPRGRIRVQASTSSYDESVSIMPGGYVFSAEQDLRVTVAALMFAVGETQADLGRGIGLAQAQVSRRQAGTTAWSLADLDRLAAHFGIPVPDLLAGTDHAVRLLPAHRRAAALGGTPAVTVPHDDQEGGGDE